MLLKKKRCLSTEDISSDDSDREKKNLIKKSLLKKILMSKVKYRKKCSTMRLVFIFDVSNESSLYIAKKKLLSLKQLMWF